jgi:hypothetical protein
MLRCNTSQGAGFVCARAIAALSAARSVSPTIIVISFLRRFTAIARRTLARPVQFHPIGPGDIRLVGSNGYPWVLLLIK